MIFASSTTAAKNPPRNIHHEIAVDAKCLSVQRFGEKVSMLQVRPHMNDPKLPVRDTFPNEMVPDVDMLRIRCGSGIIRQVQRPYVILVNRGAPYVTIRKDKIPYVTQEKLPLSIPRPSQHTPPPSRTESHSSVSSRKTKRNHQHTS